MKNYHNQYIRSEDLDWDWSSDSKAKTHTLKITHLPTNQTVTGSISESRGNNSIQQRKLELHDSLNDKLKKLIFGD